jgi:hypothetical protein
VSNGFSAEAVTPAEVGRMLDVLPCTIPVFLWGPPGIGKTEVVRQAAERHGAELVVLRASELRPEELVGLPSLRDEGYTTFAPLLDLYRLTRTYEAGGHGAPRPPGGTILFLDEFTNASPEVMPSFQYLILNRVLGGPGSHPLLPDVRIVAAGNREEDQAYAHALSAPLLNRLVHFEVKPDREEWSGWARRSGVLPVILAFLSRREECFFEPGPCGSRAFPSPRSWHMLSDVLRALDVAGSVTTELRRAAIIGTVGPGAGTEFFRFEQYAGAAPSADDILADPDGTSTHDSDPAIAIVAVENILAGVRRNADRYADAAVLYLTRMHAEYRALFLHALADRKHPLSEESIARVLRAPTMPRLQIGLRDIARALAEAA